ncbi:MAG TPA: hypothetical protein PKA80_14840 [Ignavibacteriaceae bacterium]|nr:hypothetical protein [Ignavibacteriaceae bacterium]
MKYRFDNFIELYFEALEENIDEVIAQLEEEGIDTEQSQQDTLELIKQKKAELKLEQGEQFKKAYQTQVPTEKSSPDSLTQNLHMLAARNQKEGFNEMERKDLLTEQEKLKLIAKLKNQNKKPHP